MTLTGDTAASRLCKGCGLCCDGSLFPRVHLQPSDSAQELKGQGMLVHHKKKYDFFEQPCSCFKQKSCSIYEQRPSRCRLFECQQLKRLKTAETTETAVEELIFLAHQKINDFKKLLQLSGKSNPKNPLTKQYEQIIAEPVNSDLEKEKFELREQLILAFENLQLFFKKEFFI